MGFSVGSLLEIVLLPLLEVSQTDYKLKDRSKRSTLSANAWRTLSGLEYEIYIIWWRLWPSQSQGFTLIKSNFGPEWKMNVKKEKKLLLDVYFYSQTKNKCYSSGLIIPDPGRSLRLFNWILSGSQMAAVQRQKWSHISWQMFWMPVWCSWGHYKHYKHLTSSIRTR